MHTWTFIMHRCNCLSDTAETSHIHTSIHSTCPSHSLTENMVAEVKMDEITYLMKNSIRNQLRRCNVPPNHRPACSSISQQRCHPRGGHDSPRNKGTSRLTQNTAKLTQLGLSGHQQDNQANMVRFIRPSKSWERLNAKLVSSLQSQGHLHEN